jgi:hypothetical protein
MGCARQIAFSGPLLCGSTRRAARPRLVLLALLAFVLRALIPVGFMPATDGTLSLTICTDGLPPALLTTQAQHPGHGDPDAGDSFCAFTMGFSSAPPPILVAAFALLVICLGVVLTRVLAPAGIRLFHIPQARAPPRRA